MGNSSGEIDSSNGSNNNLNKPLKQQSTPQQLKAFITPPQVDTSSCKGCGRRCKPRQCQYFKHPGYNKEARKWSESTMGKLYSTKVPNGPGKDKGREVLAANWVPNTAGVYGDVYILYNPQAQYAYILA